ncbi:MAG: LPS export ABC transporter periplasmic protein LptC [Alcaligenaceae bacterium]|nr:LPS export ABC transporter periplasmic protein LptC [Alcaligenaceae bacterium]
MKDRLPSVVAVMLLISLVIGTWWAADYAQRAVPIDPPRRVTHEPDHWAAQFVLIRGDEQGMAINRLEGDYLEHFPDTDSYEIQQAHAIGQRPGSPLTIASSDTAVMDEDGSRVTMTGNAHVHRKENAENRPLDVKSDVLILLPDEDVVYTDHPALVVHGNSTMNGTGMRYDNKTLQLQVYSATDVKISGQDTQERRERSSDRTEKQP